MTDYIFDLFQKTPVRDIEVYVATDETPDVLAEIGDERVRQVDKWGAQTLPNGTGGQWAVAATEAKRVTDARTADGSVTWTDVLLGGVFAALAEDDPESLRAGLVRVAAVATSWVEDIDRKADERDRDETIRDAWLGR